MLVNLLYQMIVLIFNFGLIYLAIKYVTAIQSECKGTHCLFFNNNYNSYAIHVIDRYDTVYGGILADPGIARTDRGELKITLNDTYSDVRYSLTAIQSNFSDQKY